jgi:hypothetical protein
MALLVDTLVDTVRVQLDESNTSDISDTKILQALNRAQMKLVRLATRRFPAMFRAETTLSVNSGTNEVTIPESAFGLIVTAVDVIASSQAYKVEAARLEDLTVWDNDSVTSSYPAYWAQQGSVLKLFPRPTSSVSLRVRYQARPPDLVKSQGRVTAFDANSVTADLDAIGTSLTTSIAALGAFVNWVDSTTGLVKATLQVSALSDAAGDAGTVTFKTAGLGRTTVFGQTVATALPSDASQDDYLCLASGTCIPMLVSDYADYLVQFAVVELKRKQGEDVTAEFAALKDLEADVTAMWAGRPGGKRVRRVSAIWGSTGPALSRYL